MGIIKNALNKEVNKGRGQIYLPTTGTIEAYSQKTNLASVSYDNPNGDGRFHLESVPVSIFAGGIAGFNGIQVGMECCITFINGNVFSPVIVGVYSNYYEQKDMGDNGSCLVSRNILEAEKPSDLIPMTETWIDETNSDPNKYINDYSDYINRDVDAFIYDTITNISKFKDTEQGLVNIESGSGIKIKDNGDIDIFIDNNSGVRISKQNHEINFYGLTLMTGNSKVQSQPISTVINNINNTNVDNSNADNNTDIDIEIENTLSNKDVQILKLATLIAEMNGKAEAIEVVITVLNSIGNPDSYGSIQQHLNTYKRYREDFYRSKNSMSYTELKEMYDNIYVIYEEFNQEISDILNNGTA